MKIKQSSKSQQIKIIIHDGPHQDEEFNHRGQMTDSERIFIAFKWIDLRV